MSYRLKHIAVAVGITLCAQSAARAEGERIAEISVKGNHRIDSAAILNAVKLKAGDSAYSDRIDADVKAIFKLGHFQDVTAETVPSAKGLAIVYTVKEKPIVREVKFEGNKEVSTEKLSTAAELKPGSVFTRKDLAKSINKLKKHYADEGYYLAEIQATVDEKAESDVKLLFKITEGEKVLIKSIRFEGNKAFKEGKLKGVMETSEKWFLSWLTGAGTYKEDVLKNDANLITDFYYNNGYINVKVGEPEVKLTNDKSGLVVTIGITEGEQYRAGVLGFKGDLLETEQELGKRLKLKQGEIFNRSLLRTDVFALTDVYADKGYAFANVSPNTKVNPDKKTVDVVFNMEKGEKVYIDRINITGNTRTRDKVVRRDVKLVEGDLYSSTALKKTKQSLMNLGFFEEVNVTTAKGSADNKLDVNVDVKEKATGTFSIGAGWSSLDGPIGQGSVSQANFLGLGLRATLSASIGGKSSTYNLGILDPYFLDSRWAFGGDVYRTEREYIDFKRRVTGADLKAGYPLSDEVSTLWIYKYEIKDIYDIATGLVTLVPETSMTTSSITASISRNTTDYRLDPSTGMVNNLALEYAGIGGTNKFMRYHADTAHFFPAKWDTVFSLRGAVDLLTEVGNKQIAIDDKFYLGGINTIRGYKARSISPKDRDDKPGHSPGGGNLIGGNKDAYINAEYIFPLLKDVGMKGVVFLDAGNSWGNGEMMFSSFLASYGGGIRWNSPMGPLRLEYGIPINPRPEDTGGHFEFSIGGFF